MRLCSSCRRKKPRSKKVARTNPKFNNLRKEEEQDFPRGIRLEPEFTIIVYTVICLTINKVCKKLLASLAKGKLNLHLHSSYLINHEYHDTTILSWHSKQIFVGTTKAKSNLPLTEIPVYSSRSERLVKVMEFMSLNFALNHLASTGTAFSVEHAMALQATLTDLCKQNNFYNMYFWGKIQGTENDYYIVYGVGKDFLKDRTYFYSLEWVQLAEPTPLTIELTLASTGRFVGNPAAICETEISANHEDTIDELGDEEEDGSIWVTFKEEERLAATVSLIQTEAELIPRGFLIKDPTGSISQNKAFEGLPKEEALQLVSYFHVRPAEIPWDKHIVGRPDYNLTLDFLHSIANDLPIGCWTISLDNIETVATLRSLFWPGAHGAVVIKNNRQHHMCGWGLFSWWYIGTGKKNWDVPFMIAPPPSLAKACVIETEDKPQIELDERGKTYSVPETGYTVSLPRASRINSVKSTPSAIRRSSATMKPFVKFDSGMEPLPL